jgi:glycosyltransferase involved in cell wall biosynthesis
MKEEPLISLVVPFLNDAAQLEVTLQSVLDQDHRPLDIIVQDCGSEETALAAARIVAARHPDELRIFVDGPLGAADALNHGFAQSRGDIFGVLNVGDRLLPGALRTVAKEVDPRRNRFVVFGRCAFLLDEFGFTAVEYPCSYRDRFSLLSVWKSGLMPLPQPSVFWHRDAWESCGVFDAKLSDGFDYDLFCRFSERFRFHPVDQLLSLMRVRGPSEAWGTSEQELLQRQVDISMRYWGTWLSPLRWRCEACYRLNQWRLHEHARHHARKAEEAALSGKRTLAGIEFLKTCAYSPRMASVRLLQGWIEDCWRQ